LTGGHWEQWDTLSTDDDEDDDLDDQAEVENLDISDAKKVGYRVIVVFDCNRYLTDRLQLL
jgi:hypothetical protein